MKREVCKFLSGSFAALAYAHAAYAVATSRDIINEPVFLGKRWGVGYMWTEAAVYSAASLVLGYLGWRGASEQRLPSNEEASAAARDYVQVPSGAAGSSSVSVK